MQKIIQHIRKSLEMYYPESEISGFIRIIIEHITKQPYTKSLLENKDFSLKEQNEVDSIIERLKTYEPIQYITEETEFFGLSFFVNKNVLIPRPETEELIELILKENEDKKLQILDIGTGSGAIAIALAKHLKNADIWAWDFSHKALDVAVFNSKILSVDISFKIVDVLSDYLENPKFDIIVSNPPYVLESEKEMMEANVLKYEPHSALFVPDNRALLFYERIADIALDILNPNGKLYFEINRAKAEETMNMLKKKGFVNTALFQDLSRNDRMVRAELTNQAK